MAIRQLAAHGDGQQRDGFARIRGLYRKIRYRPLFYWLLNIMGLKGDKNTQINLEGKSKNSLKKIVVQSVYYCGKRVKILLLN